MLNEVLRALNNYFYEYTLNAKNHSYTKDITFTSNNGLAGDFADTFIIGEYIYIEDSRLNDGVYLITEIDDTTITIDATLDITISTEAEISCDITKLYIPKSLIALISEIKTYNTNSTTGAASESQGGRSISYDGGSSWQKAFSGRLAPYKKLRW